MTSVIIGKNGIGKSYLLRAITDIFRTIDNIVNRDGDVNMPDLQYRFSVSYLLDGHNYIVSDIYNGIIPVGRNIVHSFWFCKDGQNVRCSDILLPRTVIASSMTIADKFPTPTSGIYKYRGVRSERTPSTTGTRTIVRKAVEGIMDSLVLIDEPENSSHPNWQMNYIGWLRKIFKSYRDCHFIIATHSHFLLTDMRPEWSSIVALDKTEKGLENIEEGVNTFCWSTDDILYRVFHVRNTRNYAFEDDLMKLYALMSEGKKDSEEAKRLYLKLKKFVLPGNDPLLRLIKMMDNA